MKYVFVACVLLLFNKAPNSLDELVFGGVEPSLSLTGKASACLTECMTRSDGAFIGATADRFYNKQKKYKNNKEKTVKFIFKNCGSSKHTGR